ncbi:MAG: serine hydrolase domain-containing protein [Anaerolineae bacterium]
MSMLPVPPELDRLPVRILGMLVLVAAGLAGSPTDGLTAARNDPAAETAAMAAAAATAATAATDGLTAATNDLRAATAPAASIAGASNSEGAVAQDDDPWPLIDACMRAGMAGVPGAAIAIAVGNEPSGSRAYGVKSLDTGDTVGDETMFRIGSTTKTLTAAAALQLRDQGLVDLDTPISQYLEVFSLAEPCDADCVHVHHLLTHSSGIPATYRVSDVFTPLQDWVSSLSSEPLMASPGAFWNYANQNFSLAGAVVEAVAEQPYDEYMHEHVFAPSGMARTTASAIEVVALGDYAVGHNGAMRIEPGDRDFPMAGPASGVWSTPSDMVLFALQLNKASVAGGEDQPAVTHDAAADMLSPQIALSTVPWAHYGYGVFVTDYADIAEPSERVIVYDHSGSTTGFSSLLYWVPERGVAVSILANTARPPSGAGQCVLRELAGVEPLSASGLETGPEDWQELVGTYSMLDVALWPFTAKVTLDDGQLRLRYLDVGGHVLALGAEHPLHNTYLDTFTADAEPFLVGGTMDVTFIRDDDDAAVPDRDAAAVRYMRNRRMVGERVGDVPDRVTIEGESCADVSVTAGRDMVDMEVLTSGVNIPIDMREVPIRQDDPDDPSTASNKADIRASSELTLLYAELRPSAGDELGLYLVYDEDMNGDFEYPEELVTSSLGDSGLQLLYAEAPMPPGHYQLWVHGYSVPGGASTFDVDVTAVYGDALSLQDEPSVIAEGETATFQVCADDVDPDLNEPALGAIVYQYSSPPRLFRTLVDWYPQGAAPTATPNHPTGANKCFLPVALSSAPGR